VTDIDKRQEASEKAGYAQSFSSIIDEVRLLIDAARQMASTELAYQKTRAGLMAKAAGWIAGSAVLVLALAFFLLMALVVGLLLGLATLLGPWGALGVVVGVLLIATLIAVFVALRSLRQFMVLLRDGKDPA
jgi:hypothetical protein